MRLYEPQTDELRRVADQIENVLAMCVDENGEISAEAADHLSKLEGRKQDVVLEIARYLKGEQAEAVAIKAEAARLTARAQAHERRARWLFAFLESVLETGEKYSDATAKVSWRKSSSVEVDPLVQKELDEGGVPSHTLLEPAYLKSKTIHSIDKAQALKDLRMGLPIKGLKLKEKQGLTVG